jgi:hypothetical protein
MKHDDKAVKPGKIWNGCWMTHATLPGFSRRYWLAEMDPE